MVDSKMWNIDKPVFFKCEISRGETFSFGKQKMYLHP